MSIPEDMNAAGFWLRIQGSPDVGGITMLITARTLAHKYLGSMVLSGLFLILSIPSWAVTPVEIVKLTADPNEVANAFFGWSVDLDGDTAVVGAYRETNEKGFQAGAAYVFTRSVEGVWSRQDRLIAPDGARRDSFGYRVVVSGDTIIIGAWLDDDVGIRSGSAYVFVRSSGVWSFQQKLVASDGAADDYFGSAIALDGDTALFGVARDDYDDLIDAGSVYVFTRSGDIWTEQTKLHPIDVQDGDRFGRDIALDGNSLLIAASGDDDVADNAGAAYVFIGSGSNWAQQAKLTASDPVAWDQLGIYVALSADTAILGAPYVSKAYVFVRAGVTWTQQAKLTASDGAPGDFFGSIALSGDTAVIGADGADGGCFLSDSGAAYVFTRADGLWTERAKLGASDATEKEWFGKDVAMFGDTVLITAPTLALSSIPWKGEPGSVYVFDFGIDDAGVWNALANGSFEDAGISGWFNLEGSASVGAPAAGAQNSGNAAVLTPEYPGTGASILLQNFPARPGDEFYASGYMLTENPLVDVGASRFIKLGFYHLDCDGFVITELAPEDISKGVGGAIPFPGIEGLPLLDSSSALDTWQLTQSQGVAPAGTNTASVLLMNVNQTGSAAPIWFDNIVVARLVPDMDSDGIANDIDTDPLVATVDFSDGTTSGTITIPGNQILAINDEPSPDGVRITASVSGGSGVAKVRVCGSSATLTIRPNTDLVVTCGSVILAVEPESEPVTMEIVLKGKTATVEVPPENIVTFEPEIATLAVDSTSGEPEPVVLTVGQTEVAVNPGQSLSYDGTDVFLYAIDIKPGSDPNCFNINGRGVIPVAILGSESLEVDSVDQTTLRFSGLDVRVRGNGNPSCGMEDTNADGYTDLVCHFEDDDPDSWSLGSASAALSGKLLGGAGTPISGTDSICIVP